jgi:hypothetical protein
MKQRRRVFILREKHIGLGPRLPLGKTSRGIRELKQKVQTKNDFNSRRGKFKIWLAKRREAGKGYELRYSQQ